MDPAARVIGIGSPHGDDQVGWRVVEDLAADPAPDVDAVAIGDPVDLLEDLEGCALLIVMDAYRSGQPPGRVIDLPWPPRGPEGAVGHTTHGSGVASALALAEALGRRSPVVALVCVEVESCEPATGLSPALRRALPEVRCRIMAIIGVGPGSDVRAVTPRPGSSSKGR